MSTNMYASRKRKKPQRSVKPPPEGAKSNPSKRHRERLNGELDRLASLLPYPQDVISKLDKLTILRLCVSYLRAKSFFNVTLKSTASQRPESNVLKKQGSELQVPEGELLLQVLNGFALVVTAGGTIFYASSTIQDYLGFHQSDVVHQSVYDVIHTEDRAELQRQLHWALNPTLTTDTGQLVSDSASPQTVTVYNPEALPPENSTFLERNFVCRLRCLLDNSTGFLALNIQGRLKFLHGQSERTKEGKAIPPQLALFALASPLQTPTILEIRTKNFIFKTKHKLDFTPTACDAKGKMVLGYTEAELCNRGSGYQFIHAADMLHCAENHMRMIKTGESGMTVFRLLTKLTGWVWVQANARLVYKNGRPECIIASQRVLTDEEGEDTLRKRSLQLPFSYTTGEALLYDTSFPKTLVTGDSLACDTTCPTENTTNNNQDGTLDPDSLLGSLLKQEKSIYYCSPQTQNQHQLQEEVAGLPQGECGGIFSSSGQEGSILSLSETVLFKQEPLGVGGGGGIDGFSSEDRDRDLWSFMRNLGNSREDLELFQQDELFLDVDLDAGRDGLLPDLTDEILSYVQESLRKRSDWDQTVFSCRGAKLGDQDYSCPTTLLHQPSMEQPLATHPHSTTVLLHQPSMEQPLTPHPHSTTVLLHQPSVEQPLTPHPHSTTVLLHQPSMEQPLTPHPHSTTVLLHQPSVEQPLTPHPHSTTVMLHQPSVEQPLTPHPHSTTVLLHQPSVEQPLTPHPHSTTVLLHQPSMEQPLTPHPHSTTVLLHQPSVEQPLTPHPHSTTVLLHQPSVEQPLTPHPHSTTVLLHQPSVEQPLTPHPHSTTVMLHQPSVEQPLTPHPHSTTVLLHQPSMEQPLTPHPHSTTVLLHQPSVEQPLTPHPHSTTVPQWPPQLPVVHPLSVHHYQPPPHYPQQPIPQQCLHTQPRPQEALQATQQQHRLSQRPQRQQQNHLNGQVLPKQQRQNNQLYSQSQPFHPQQRQQQLCNRLEHMQVDGTGTGSMTERQKDITKQQQKIPPLFNVEQLGGLQTHRSHPQHGHLCLGEASLGLPYRNQLNIVSVSRSLELSSYVPTTGLQSQRVDGELPPQDLEELLGSLESTGPRGIEDGRGAHQWSVVEALGVFQQQGHLPDGQAQSQATSTDWAQHAYPLAVGFSRVNRAERPFTAQFQNGSLQEAGPDPGPVPNPGSSRGADPGPVPNPGSSRGADPGPVPNPGSSRGAGPVPNPGSSRGADRGHSAAGQPTHQPPPPAAESRPYPDLPLRRFM
ncbi:aryl hydrocarbon receptor-like isoform X2 [Coregonus clupeaformis]|uniref:aryl hydrocarbon receptor-like isoform X2 n=1 Tax=Coregonus clupeaformis TaxID=59861 RepID=UPI001BE067A2|nr:aryl hydrocarbon receptor-like isoform X2 [Coregonus clupeaformis]